MSEAPATNSNIWSRSLGYNYTDESYPYTINDGFNSAGQVVQYSAKDLAAQSAFQSSSYTSSSMRPNQWTPWAEHFPNIEHHAHAAEMEGAYAYNVHTSQQRLYPPGQIYYPPSQIIYASHHSSGQHVGYEQRSVSSDQGFPVGVDKNPNWARKTSEGGDSPSPSSSVNLNTVTEDSQELHSLASLGHTTLVSRSYARPEQASNCAEPRYQKNGVQTPVSSSREGKERQCPICSKWLDPKPSNWQRHEDTHSGEKRYWCMICGEARITKDQVILHVIRSHMDVKTRKPLQQERDEARTWVAAL